MRILIWISVFLMSTGIFAQSNDQAAKEVIAAARAQWAAEIAKDYDASNAMLADEYTEFNPQFPYRLDGKSLLSRMSEAQREDGGASLFGDMVNAKVQVYGDVAILTYNYIGLDQDKDGAVSPSMAKSTRVYAKKDGKWMLVHANFAPGNIPD